MRRTVFILIELLAVIAIIAFWPWVRYNGFGRGRYTWLHWPLVKGAAHQWGFLARLRPARLFPDRLSPEGLPIP